MMFKPHERRIITVDDQELARRCLQGRVVIIDDDAELLAALASALHMEGYACETYLSAQAYFRGLIPNTLHFPGPSCLLCDVRMPELDGLELQQRLSERESAPMILMSGSSGINDAVRAFRSGAVDFLIKPFETDDLFAAIAKGLVLCTQGQAAQAKEESLSARLANMTEREREVARRVCAGQTNMDIADALGISLRSIKRHRQHAMEKFGASGSAEFVRLIADALGPLAFQGSD